MSKFILLKFIMLKSAAIKLEMKPCKSDIKLKKLKENTHVHSRDGEIS